MTRLHSDPPRPAPTTGAGLGLRREMFGELFDTDAARIDFVEVAPENWIGIGGRHRRQFDRAAERWPVFLHGLSLNIGGQAPLDQGLLQGVRGLLDTVGCGIYSEHLSYCADDGHLYDLLPIPYTEEAVAHVVERILRVQDQLGQRIALENSSYYYAAPDQAMQESEFIVAVCEAADCELLLDVNNVYVNSINHGYQARQFIAAMPAARVRYLHVAGHYVEAEDLRVDTHGADVIDPVWELLQFTYDLLGPLPTLLERDFNIPPLQQLLQEVDTVRALQGTVDQHEQLAR